MKFLELTRISLFCAVLAIALSIAPNARATGSCGGQVHQNLCGNSTDIYPCCPNGGNCTWWAWEMVCRNWHLSLVNWGNANTWAAHARLDPRFDVVGQPVVNSVGTATPRSGHVAWVIGAGGGGVTVTEEIVASDARPARAPSVIRFRNSTAATSRSEEAHPLANARRAKRKAKRAAADRIRVRALPTAIGAPGARARDLPKFATASTTTATV